MVEWHSALLVVSDRMLAAILQHMLSLMQLSRDAQSKSESMILRAVQSTGGNGPSSCLL